jgi:hypothetical protein
MFLHLGRYEETTAVWENEALRPTQVAPDKYTMSLIVSAYTKSSKPHTGKWQTCRCWTRDDRLISLDFFFLSVLNTINVKQVLPVVDEYLSKQHMSEDLILLNSVLFAAARACDMKRAKRYLAR